MYYLVTIPQQYTDGAADAGAITGIDCMSRSPDNNLDRQSTSCPLRSLPGSGEFLPVTLATSLPSEGLKTLTEEAKANLITQLANDPEGISLMREAVTRTASTHGEATNSHVNSTCSRLQSLHLGDVPLITDDEIKHQTETTPTLQCEAMPISHSTTPTLTSAPNYGTDGVLSSPVEIKSANASLYRRQTSTTSTQTDNEMSLSLTQAGVIESIASSEGTGCTQTASLTRGKGSLRWMKRTHMVNVVFLIHKTAYLILNY